MNSEIIMEAVEKFMLRGWQWGVSDCCTTACDVFNELHGIDPMKAVRSQYNTIGGAARLIKSWGGFSAMVASLTAGQGLHIGNGLPGELGLSSQGIALGPEGRALLICIEPGAWAGKTEFGYAIISNAERCWRV